MAKLLGTAVVLLVLIGSMTPQRASAAVIGYWAPNMNGAIEVSPNNSTGTGTAWVTYDNVAHTMRVEATFSGLSSNTSAAHIHTPTAVAFTGGASVATQTPSFAGFPLGVTAGIMDNTFDLTLASSWNSSYVTAKGGIPQAETAFFQEMDAGKAYFNIHTVNFGVGEIRGFMLVPEPGALTLLGAAGVVAMIRRRRAI